MATRCSAGTEDMLRQISKLHSDRLNDQRGLGPVLGVTPRLPEKPSLQLASDNHLSGGAKQEKWFPWFKKSKSSKALQNTPHIFISPGN